MLLVVTSPRASFDLSIPRERFDWPRTPPLIFVDFILIVKTRHSDHGIFLVCSNGSLTVLILKLFCCIVNDHGILLIMDQLAEARMIKDVRLLAEFEDNEIRKEPSDYGRALRLFEAMWKEGMLLGVLPLKDPLEGIEVDIRIARILNDVRATD
jgi:hypothetical protein